MCRPYEAIISQLLLDTNRRTARATCYHYMLSLFKHEHPHFTHAIFLLRRPCCVLLCVVYLVGRVSLVFSFINTCCIIDGSKWIRYILY
jgi:hypothetical protein